jgi:hypothetical protein
MAPSFGRDGTLGAVEDGLGSSTGMCCWFSSWMGKVAKASVGRKGRLGCLVCWSDGNTEALTCQSDQRMLCVPASPPPRQGSRRDG